MKAVLACCVLLVFVVSYRLTLPFYAGLVAIICAVVADRATRRFGQSIPSAQSRIRDLVPYAMTSEFILWHRDHVAALVRKLVIEQLGLKKEEYRENAEFVKDFGMDR
jgi:hypothetical protein